MKIIRRAICFFRGHRDFEAKSDYVEGGNRWCGYCGKLI